MTCQEKSYKDFGISDETWESMKRFFVKTSAPRIIAKREAEKLEAEKELAKK